MRRITLYIYQNSYVSQSGGGAPKAWITPDHPGSPRITPSDPHGSPPARVLARVCGRARAHSHKCLRANVQASTRPPTRNTENVGLSLRVSGDQPRNISY